MKQLIRNTIYGAALAVGLNFALPGTAAAHCDSVDGPVISEAKQALTSGDVTPLLKWVPAEDEAYIKTVFDKVYRVHRQGGDARAFADHHLFATLVEVHRAAEGAPFTGVKPAGGIDPAIAAADKALLQGDIDSLVAAITARFEQSVRERFDAAMQARALADDSVPEGREFVERYVQYVHYIEAVHAAVAAADDHAHENALTARTSVPGHAH